MAKEVTFMKKSGIKTNQGPVDRVARVILGIIILGVGVYYQSWWGLIGLVPAVIGIWGYCPLYGWLDFSTNK
jgi:hypothetical protein